MMGSFRFRREVGEKFEFSVLLVSPNKVQIPDLTFLPGLDTREHENWDFQAYYTPTVRFNFQDFYFLDQCLNKVQPLLDFTFFTV